jgi:hypothetical protein
MSAPLRDIVPAKSPASQEARLSSPEAPPPIASRKPSLLPSSPLFAIAGIVLGVLWQLVFNLPLLAHGLWTIALIGAGFPVVWRTLVVARRGNFATDVVASLSIVTAAIIGQPLAGLVIVLMQTSLCAT